MDESIDLFRLFDGLFYMLLGFVLIAWMVKNARMQAERSGRRADQRSEQAALPAPQTIQRAPVAASVEPARQAPAEQAPEPELQRLSDAPIGVKHGSDVMEMQQCLSDTGLVTEITHLDRKGKATGKRELRPGLVDDVAKEILRSKPRSRLRSLWDAWRERRSAAAKPA